MSRMGKWPLHPLVYEINTAVWLTSLSRTYGRPISLGGIPQAELERLAELRFDGVWLMGVWQRSAASRTIARAEPALLGEYRRALPDVRPDDIIGSPYAIADYTVDPLFGGDQELAERCDGLRCDMAMLVTADVFCRTWGGRFDPPGADFWPDAIRGIKRAHPGFLMLAEVYWDLEYDLQQQGFDFTYDKRLYDRF